MAILTSVQKYWRFAWALRDFLRHPITLEQAKAIVRQRMAQREENFLSLVERAIYHNPRSPYLPLLKLAHCELGDLQRSVRSKELEATLRELHQAGVYITFEEFKGRTPIVRNGKTIPVHVEDFNNPHLSHYYQAESGGTTGKGVRVSVDLNHLAAQAAHFALAYDAYGLLDAPTVLWRGILPDSSGMNNLLRGAHFGNVPKRWFSPLNVQELRKQPAAKFRLATQGIVLVGKLWGVPLPWPRRVGLEEAAVVARWAAETLKTHGPCVIRATVGRAVRVCLAAQEEGLDLTGAVFMGGGESPTPAKVRQITRTGARWVATYAFSEAGMVGLGCARPLDGNDVHLLQDAFAVIQSPHRIPGWETTVDAFHFTSLLPTAPKILLNVQIDDCGLLEKRPCGCALEGYGFHEHLRQIRSFTKLTSEGVNLAEGDMVRVLEEVLPARFGGSLLDYQLVEEEDEHGLTRLQLLINPSISIADEREVVETVLDALWRNNAIDDMVRAVWAQGKTLRVRRQAPIWTARGKFMSLHLMKREDRSS
ncbi:MAG TPA: hypothetical protein VIL47_01520 [Candidatus Bipolaricaulota bacterium]